MTRKLTREDLREWYRRTRVRTANLFEIPTEEAYYAQPIALRNPIVFYEGHLPAFAVNTLLKLALRQPGLNEAFEILFARGIDPDSEDAVDGASLWPKRREVQSYRDAAQARIENAIMTAPFDDAISNEAVFTIIEHELMHQETLLYMFHNLPYEQKVRRKPRIVTNDSHLPNEFVRIPRGVATLGASREDFGWDNEFPEHRIEVGEFRIQRYDITNREYLEYLNATGAPPPHFWIRKDGAWFWRGMFELIPLPGNWPVYVTFDEAMAYARWAGARLPTEAEYHRAAEGPVPTRGNFDFVSFEPVPVGSYPESASAWGVHDLVGNGWKWTSTPFAGFTGFKPMETYPQYSADFFDDKHFVLKGASPATARELIRKSFRNWFRPNYPFVYATFRCVV